MLPSDNVRRFARRVAREIIMSPERVVQFDAPDGTRIRVGIVRDGAAWYYGALCDCEEYSIHNDTMLAVVARTVRHMTDNHKEGEDA